MRHTVSTLAAAAALALGAATMASAQPSGYSGPSNASGASGGTYSGPSSVQLMTVRDLLENGRDDQVARLQGRIVSHDGDDDYTFEDATGRIRVEIDDDDFPAGQVVNAETRVELLGEFDKGLRSSEFEVDRMTVLR